MVASSVHVGTPCVGGSSSHPKMRFNLFDVDDSPVSHASSSLPTTTMAEPHTKTAGVPQYVRHQDDVSAGAIVPTEQVSAEFKQLKMRRKYRYVLFKIDGPQIVFDGSGAPSATFAHFRSALPESECRYAVYDHEFLTSDGRKSSKLFFVTWIPVNSSPGFKMAYTHAKSAIRGVLDGCIDVNATSPKELETGLGETDANASDSDSDFDD